MNQSLKTIIALLLVLTFATTLLIGCKNTQPSSTEPDNSTSQPADESDTTEPIAEETEPPRKPGVYFVTILPTANGTVTADHTEAEQGDTITLTVTPDEGYELLSITANGIECELSFKMPAEDVNILARFGLPEEPTEPEATTVPKVYPKGDFFGSAGGYHSSDVLNMKTDSGSSPYLVLDAGKATPLYAYVKGVTAKQFYLELTAQVTDIRSDEKYPKFGLMTSDGKEMVKFYLDMTTEKQVSSLGTVHQKSGREDDWAGQSVWNLNKKLDLTTGTVKLGLLRDGTNYYIYVNGQLAASGSDLSERKAATGIFSFGTSLKVTNYKLVKTGNDYDKLLAEAQADEVVFNQAALTENYFAKASDGVYTLTTNSDAQHLVDDVTVAGKIMRESNYNLKGRLTLTDAETWGQARILISADAQNEYFIALEKSGENSYQIFTMSKANEEGWSNWTLIDDAEQNGSRNSIDFEVIVSGNLLYFLIDDVVYYTSNRVSMAASTVKFTGYNVGTTTVENIVLEVFKDEAAAQAYADSKQSRFGENFGVSQNTYWTTGGVDLTSDNDENPTVSFVGGAPQYAYLNDVFTDKLCFETEFNVTDILNNDAYPKFGVMVNGTSEMVKFFVDMTSAMTATHVGVVYQPTGGGDDWTGSKSCQVPGMSFTGSDTVKLKLVRDGSAYYFYVNNALVLYNEDGFKNENGAVGIFSFNTVMTSSNYTVAIGSGADGAIQNAKNDIAQLTKLGLTCNWFADNGDGGYSLTTNSNAEHKVDDLTQGGNVLRVGNYSVKGKLTLTNAGDWGQARILISADAKNEYFIALERTAAGKYQIFTMSKANQTGWDKWELILHENDNGTRNSIDFELIVIGNQVHFLIDNQVVYTTSRVSMTESTVKFTGYNVGTTTIENLSARIFESQQAAQNYLTEKN